MASTNEDVVVLAKARQEDGRILTLRHLPDRGTIELGFWGDDAGAIVPQGPVFEVAAEAAEVEALADLCARAARAGGADEALSSGTLPDGARLAARRSADGGVTLAREPDDGGGAITLPPAALEALVGELLPAARPKLDHLGFGLVQQGENG